MTMTPLDLSVCFRPAMEIFARVVEGPASKCDRRRAGLVTQLEVGKDMPKHLSGWHVLARERRWKYDAVVSSRWRKLWRARLLLVASRGSRLLHSSAFDFPATPTLGPSLHDHHHLTSRRQTAGRTEQTRCSSYCGSQFSCGSRKQQQRLIIRASSLKAPRSSSPQPNKSRHHL
jgi:hypothetical protein